MSRIGPGGGWRRLAVRGVAVPATWLALALPGELRGQEAGFGARCVVQGATVEAQQLCGAMAQALEVAQPLFGLAASGGNPVPGTASTLGMRIGRIPRVSVAGRFTVVWVDLPPALRESSERKLEFTARTLNVDGAAGLFRGFSPAPTVGGVGSIDILGSIGHLSVPDREFGDNSAVTWGLGARVGILRESFLLPGVSVSAMYRRVGDLTLGDPTLLETDAFGRLGHISVWSFRGAVSKRVAGLGATAGLGYDRYSSDVRVGARDLASVVSTDDFDNGRVSAFANISWTLLILHIVGELGWQEGADRVPVVSPGSIRIDPEDGKFFGSLAIRLSIW